MSPRSISVNSTSDFGKSQSHFLQDEHDHWRDLFAMQSSSVRRFVEMQAGIVADALIQKSSQVRFTLPDQVVTQADGTQPVPATSCEQFAGGVGIFNRDARDIRSAVAQRLGELEQSDDKGLSVAAGLLRYAIAVCMVRDRLPAGRTVHYVALPGEEMPTVPIVSSGAASSAITEATDAIVEEEGQDGVVKEDAAVHVPYAEAARSFFLPQLVAFDTAVDPERLLVNAISDAEAYVVSMQNYLIVLHAAAALAPYVIADDLYQARRHGMLGQLINQARAFARHRTREIIDAIRRRASAGELNRGLSLSLPYFDDNDLEIRMQDFVVIPAGRVMFNDAFVVRAVRMEAAKIAQDTRLSASTRKHLLIEMSFLEQAFLK